MSQGVSILRAVNPREAVGIEKDIETCHLAHQHQGRWTFYSVYLLEHACALSFVLSCCVISSCYHQPTGSAFVSSFMLLPQVPIFSNRLHRAPWVLQRMEILIGLRINIENRLHRILSTLLAVVMSTGKC